MNILVTGVAGFIGFHLSKRLLIDGFNIIGIDNLNPYYDPSLKKARLEELIKISSSLARKFDFVEGNIEDNQIIESIFKRYKPEKVVNLAAQAGVRYSIENPHAYIQSNLVGFCNLLESCRFYNIEHLVYASSSSVYGGNSNLPFNEDQSVGHPVSIYAATKRANELMAHTYSHLYKIPSSGLRFFTVYGPWGRPDMALFLFTKAILNDQPIKLFNKGQMVRDFTYIDDVVESVLRILKKPATSDPFFDTNKPKSSKSWAPHRLFNIGNSSPTPLIEYINALEEALGIEAKKEYCPMQPGDVHATASNTSLLEEWIGFKPDTSIKEGVSNFVEWYREFYCV